MKPSNINSMLNLCVIACLVSCDKHETLDRETDSHPPSNIHPASMQPVNSLREQAVDDADPAERNEAQVTQLLAKAKDSNIPREHRLAALKQIGEASGDSSTRALVALISMTATDDEESRVSASGSISSRYPAIGAIKSRDKAAVPILCEQLLLIAAKNDKATDVRLICMTALTLESKSEIERLLETLAQQNKQLSSNLELARSLVTSFAKRIPTQQR